MEISQVITGMLLFAMAMFISDLYNEVKKLKGRLVIKPTRWYENKKDPFEEMGEAIKGMEVLMLRTAVATLKGNLTQKDEEIKNLKAELNKAKFDYACEVAGKK